MDEPTCFVRAGRPVSANRPVKTWHHAASEEIRRLYQAAGGVISPRLRYGVVYYFALDYGPKHADADNISKPVWDALRGAAYDDDRLVRLRVSGVIEAGRSLDGSPSLHNIDLSHLTDPAAHNLFALLEAGEKHLIYVEIGSLGPSMFRFNLCQSADDYED